MANNRTNSPLRYPGGKSCLYELTRELILLNDLRLHHYAEPFAGGCGLALSLMYSGLVSHIHINDVDPAIWSFWNAVLHHTDKLVDRIEDTAVTLEEWERQKKQLRTAKPGSVDLAFSAFFLNRTNRSGVIKKAGVIGGFAQDGKYLIDCRFNKENLIARINRIAKYKDRIHLTNLDALEFLENKKGAIPPDTFFCIDPPYFKKGKSLYMSFYQGKDHEQLSHAVQQLNHPWMVTYDNAPEIRGLYEGCQQHTFGINYSVNVKRVGTELLISPHSLNLPEVWEERPLTEFAQ